MRAGRYILEKYAGKATRHTCPECGEKGEFTRYIDTQTGELLPEKYGRCNREIKCGYHLRPGSEIDYQYTKPPMPVQNTATDYIPETIYGRTLGRYERNSLFVWMQGVLGIEPTIKAFNDYRVGTSKQWGGSPIFWQFDEAMRCRSGKVMGYQNGRRVKEPFPQITWAHSLLKLEPFNFGQVLYGLHLAELDRHKGIGIVESEKSALICAIAEPNVIWLATGGLQNLTRSKLYPLRRRKVVLYPDLGAFDKWKEKAQDLAIDVEISTTIESMTGLLPTGFDMGDLHTTSMQGGALLNQYGYPSTWD